MFPMHSYYKYFKMFNEKRDFIYINSQSMCESAYYHK